MSDAIIQVVKEPDNILYVVSEVPSIVMVDTGIQGPSGPSESQGVQGIQGIQGVQGPEYQGDDLPDFTLIFDNKLI